MLCRTTLEPNKRFVPSVSAVERICNLALVKAILGSILSTDALATRPAPTASPGSLSPSPGKEKTQGTRVWFSVTAASSRTFIGALGV